MAKPKSTLSNGVLYGIACLSGAAALTYELVWTRYFTIALGVSIYAVSAVVAAFMLGMALGYGLFGRLADRQARPLLLYACLEAGLGLYALLFPEVLNLVQQGYLLLFSEALPGALILATRIAAAFLVLLVPAALMGGTLPILSRLFVRGFEKRGGRLAALYGLNTLGAAAGVVTTGFVLIPTFGLRKTTALAVAVNVLLAAASGLLHLRYRRFVSAAPVQTPARPSHVPAISPGYRILLAAAVTGFCSLGYEILWTRMLVLTLGNSSWAFTTVLAAFLGSLALGSLVVSPIVDRHLNSSWHFGLVQSALALLAVLSLWIFRWGSVQSWFHGDSTLTAVVVWQFAVSLLVVAPAALLSGLSLPMLARLCIQQQEGIASGFGRVLAWNTVGAVLGSLLVALVFLQWKGIQKSLVLLALFNALLALYFLIPARTVRNDTLAAFVRVGGYAVALLLAMGLFLRYPPLSRALPGYSLEYYRETTIGTLAVYRAPETDTRIFDINNITEVATDSLSLHTFDWMAALPLLLRPEADSILVVTFGAGIVAGRLAELAPAAIECVEINPAARDIGELFEDVNHHVLKRPSLRLVIEDGRHFLLTRRQRYDIITADATHPTAADSWLLYTREYYRLCRRHLRRDGIFLQWLPLHALSPQHYRTIIATCKEVFPQIVLFFTGIEGPIGHTLLVAGDRLPALVPPAESPYDSVRNVTRKTLLQLGLASVDDIPLHVLADSRTRPDRFAFPRINSDDLPHTAFPDRLPGPDFALRTLQFLVPPSQGPESLPSQSSALWIQRREQCLTLLRSFIALQTGDEAQALYLLQKLTASARWSLPLAFRRLQSSLAEDLGNRGLAAIEKRELDRAGTLLDTAVRLGHYTPEIVLQLADLFKQRGADSQREHLLESAVRRLQDSRIYFELATLWLEKRDLDRAASAYHQALTLDPALGAAWTNLGMVYALKQQWEAAQRAWERALQVDPADSLAHRNLERLKAMRQ